VRIPTFQEVIRTIQLAHGESYRYYRDYPRYLARQRITFHAFEAATQHRVGWGYALYLPEGYEADPQQDWPLIVFLIGTGERGHSLSLLTKHGPLRTVLDGQPLPFIITSPMLEVSPDFRSFPEDYLDRLMEEILADYREDPGRVYLTGLSMGGEATYRYALHRPDLFAALAPLAAFRPQILARFNSGRF
jgi:predicted peptidase